jgi:hypothetical protein
MAEKTDRKIELYRADPRTQAGQPAGRSPDPNPLQRDELIAAANRANEEFKNREAQVLTEFKSVKLRQHDR